MCGTAGLRQAVQGAHTQHGRGGHGNANPACHLQLRADTVTTLCKRQADVQHLTAQPVPPTLTCKRVTPVGIVPAMAIHAPRRGSVGTAEKYSAQTKLQVQPGPPVDSSGDSSTAQALPLNVQSPGTMHQAAGHPPGRHHNEVWLEALGRWSNHRLIHLQCRKVPCTDPDAARHAACQELNSPTTHGRLHARRHLRTRAAAPFAG